MSWTTAPVSEVTTPIRRGNEGRDRLRAASNRPSAASFFRVRWYAAQKAPTPAGVAAHTRSCTVPFRGNTSTSPDTTTSMPSSRSNPKSSASSRKSVQETCAVASFSVKNTWPAGAVWRLLTSPRTRMRFRIGFARTVSRISRASCATVIAAGTPGLGSQGTAMGSIIRKRKSAGMNGSRGEMAESVEGDLRRVEEILRGQQGMEPHADFREQQFAALLPIDDANTVLDDGAVSPQPLDRAAQRPAGRDDVLDEEHTIPATQLALELVLRAMFLRGFAHHDIGLAARQADRRGDGDRTELDARDPIRVPRARRHAVRDHAQHIRSRDRLLDIYVIRRRPAAGERESPELQGPRRLQRGDEPRAVDLTRAHASSPSDSRRGSRPDAGRA